MSFKKITKVFTVLSFTLLLGASVVMAADKPVLSVGTSTLNSEEVLNMIATTAGGNQMMVGLMLAQATLPERIEMVNQMAHALLFAEGAKSKGLDSRSDIAFQIKWQTIQILTQAYFEQNASKWDMSEKSVKNYYDTHLGEFYDAPAAHTRHILTETEGEALNAAMEIYRTKDFAKVATEYSKDPSCTQNGGDLGWIEKGAMTPPVDEAIQSASLGSLVGPIKSDFGWHVVEVIERRPGKQLSFQESGERAVQGLQRQYFNDELKKLEAKYGVKIDEEALANIGGIPAPAVAQ